MSIKGKIAIASDDKTSLQTLINIVEPLKYEILTYKSLKKLERDAVQESPDLLILDADSLEGDCYELVKELKATLLPKLPIMVITSASVDENFTKLIKESKINDFLRKPVSYSLLLEKVKRLLLVEQAPVSIIFDDGPEFNFTGNISEIPLPRILYCLKRDSRTGVLVITREKFKKVISFEHGDPKFVVSNIVEECLGRLLVAKGRLTREECEESLKLMREWKKKQGETLIKMGLIEPYELDENLKMQARERLIEAFGWQTGEYRFFLKKFLREDLTPIDVEIPQIVLMGIRRYYTLEFMKQYLDMWLDRIPVFNKKAIFKLDDFRFATWDAKTVRFFDGKKTFRDIVAQRIVRDVDVYHLVFAFGTLGVIKFEETEVSKTNPAHKKSGRVEPVESESLNAYQVLDVDYGASDEKIKLNYEALLLKYASAEIKTSGKELEGIRGSLARVKQAYEKIKGKETRLPYLKHLFLNEGVLTRETMEVITYGEIIEKGKEYIAKKDYTRANLLFLNGIRIYPGVGLIFIYLGYTIFLSIGKSRDNASFLVSEARKYFNKGLLLSAEEEEPHLFYGKFLKYLGKEDNARKEFMKVIQLNPENREALQELRLLSLRDKKRNTSFMKWKK